MCYGILNQVLQAFKSQDLAYIRSAQLIRRVLLDRRPLQQPGQPEDEAEVRGRFRDPRCNRMIGDAFGQFLRKGQSFGTRRGIRNGRGRHLGRDGARERFERREEIRKA